MAKLLIISGEDVGSVYELTGTITIGRSDKNPIYINDPRSSKENSIITKETDGFYIQDLDSQNGTWINDEKIKIRKLNNGDLITIGRTTFRVILTDTNSIKGPNQENRNHGDSMPERKPLSRIREFSRKPSLVKRIISLLFLFIFFVVLTVFSKIAGAAAFERIIKSQKNNETTNKSPE